MKHVKYLNYTLKHKWFVFIECCKLAFEEKCHILIWAGIVHDLSKFTIAEWFPYANYYGKKDKDKFNYAVLHHHHSNKHHWQYWILNKNSDKIYFLKMPKRYLLEMVADWRGVGRASKGIDDILEFYEKNKYNIKLHPETREELERIIYKGIKSDNLSINI